VWCLLSFGHQNDFDATSIMLALNVYFDKYLEIIATFDDFIIQHIYKDENTVVNDLTQHAWGFWSNKGKLYVLKKSDVPICHFKYSGLQPMHSTEICSAELSTVKLDVLESETGWSDISRSSDDLGETMMTKPEDWTTPLVHYLENPSHVTDRKVQWQA
jgi:uncharacterized protein with NAD-binding domain and iron-sulfur cluster